MLPDFFYRHSFKILKGWAVIRPEHYILISKKINQRIEIVGTYKVGLGSMSQKSRKNILAVLTKYYSDVRITIIKEFSDLEALARRKPDLVFLGMKYVPLNHELGRHDPQKVWITKYLDEAGILYTGSGYEANVLEQNKDLAKKRIQDSGLQTSPFHVVAQDQTLTQDDIKLNYPLFIKPTNRGGGEGIDEASVAYNFDQLSSKVSSIVDELHSDALIEQFLPGREFSVAILKEENSAEYSAMPIEKIALVEEGAPGILSQKIKSSDSVQDLRVTDEAIEKRLTQLALSVFRSLGARDFGRIDIRLDANGNAHFLEANLIPSLIENYGSFPKSCLLNQNMSHETIILRIVHLALIRDLASVEVEPVHSGALAASSAAL